MSRASLPLSISFQLPICLIPSGYLPAVCLLVFWVKKVSLISVRLSHRDYQTEIYADAGSSALSLNERYSKHQFSWKVLGALLGQIGRISEALKASQKAVVLSPQDADAYSNLGNTLQELGRLEEAEASYTQALALTPEYAEDD